MYHLCVVVERCIRGTKSNNDVNYILYQYNCIVVT